MARETLGGPFALTQNLLCALAKLKENGRCQAFGSFHYDGDSVPDADNLLEQIRWFREAGFDGIKMLDVAKRLLDHGFYAPTIYFPLIVHEAIMIEPTETETMETLDAFVEAMRAIHAEALADPEPVRSAPHTLPVKRLDELGAARAPNVAWG